MFWLEEVNKPKPCLFTLWAWLLPAWDSKTALKARNGFLIELFTDLSMKSVRNEALHCLFNFWPISKAWADQEDLQLD